MTSLLDRARAAYASDQEERQRAYDRETEAIRRRFDGYLHEIAQTILQVPSTSVSVETAAIDGGKMIEGTVIVESMTFRLNFPHNIAMDMPKTNPVLYVVLPCIGCGEEFTTPIRSLRHLGRALDNQYCTKCRSAGAGQPVRSEVQL